MSAKSTSKKIESKVKKTDSKVKKTDSKVKKTDSKVKKEEPKKYKIYCGITDPIPKGYRLGSMTECYDAKKVMYYGVKKIDSRILNSHLNKADEKSLLTKKAGLLGLLSKLKKDVEKVKTKEEKLVIKEKFDTTKNELANVLEKLNKLKQ